MYGKIIEIRVKEKEQVMCGDPTEIKGLVQHLIFLEKEEALGEVKKMEVIDCEAVPQPQVKTLSEELAGLDTEDF